MDSRINIVLITSAEYDLEFFVEVVFHQREPYLRTWRSGGNPAYSHSGMIMEIDRDLYDREIEKKKVSTPSKFLSFFKFGDNKIEVPIMTITTSNQTFKSDNFYDFTIRKMKEADIFVMFYDKTMTGYSCLHDLIELYCKYAKEIEDDENFTEKRQPCLLIELTKPDDEYKNPESRDVSLGDQIESFRSLLINKSPLHHIRLEVSTIPPDIYSVIKSMILDIV